MAFGWPLSSPKGIFHFYDYSRDKVVSGLELPTNVDKGQGDHAPMLGGVNTGDVRRGG